MRRAGQSTASVFGRSGSGPLAFATNREGSGRASAGEIIARLVGTTAIQDARRRRAGDYRLYAGAGEPSARPEGRGSGAVASHRGKCGRRQQALCSSRMRYPGRTNTSRVCQPAKTRSGASSRLAGRAMGLEWNLPSASSWPAPVACAGDDDLPRWAEREGALVEEAMVKRAERERVLDDVGSFCPVPFDVRCLESDRFLAQANGEAAHGASVAVGGEHLVGEVAVAGLSPRRDVRGFDAHGLEDLALERRREVGVDERMGDLPREVLVGLECSVDGLGEAPVDVVLKQRFSVGVSARCHGDAFFALDVPYAVIAKSPEGVFGVDSRPVRTEVAEQRSERSVRVAVGRESWFAGETPADGPQGEERLVGARCSPALQILSVSNVARSFSVLAISMTGSGGGVRPLSRGLCRFAEGG